MNPFSFNGDQLVAQCGSGPLASSLLDAFSGSDGTRVFFSRLVLQQNKAQRSQRAGFLCVTILTENTDPVCKRLTSALNINQPRVPSMFIHQL